MASRTVAPERATPRNTRNGAAKRETVYSFALRRLRDARGWSADAAKILREQKDRIDTLDSIRMAQTALTEAADAIRATLP